MKLNILQRIARWSASLMGIFCLVSCGQMGPEFMGEEEGPLAPVRLADENDADARGQLAGSYLVMFREERIKSNLFFASFEDEYAYHYANLGEAYLSDPRVKNIDVLTAVDLSSLQSVEWEPEFSAPKILESLFTTSIDKDSAGVLTRVDFDSEESAQEILRGWESDNKIWFAEPNEVSHLAAGEFEKWGTDYETFQPWYGMINLPEAFKKIASGTLADAQAQDAILSSSTLVAVLDSGVDYEHPQLKDNIWVNTNVGAAGCPGDIHGCNTTAPSKGTLGNGDVWPNLASGPGEKCGGGDSGCDHGTHVAGIIAAKPAAGSGGTEKYGGVCPFCKVMVLKVAEVEAGDNSKTPQIRDDSQIRAFKYLTRFRKSGSSAVRLINASFGKYSRSRSLAIMVDVLKKVGTGALVIGAASNEDSMIRSYPAALSNAIAVASVGTRDGMSAVQTSVQKSWFSNFGPWVDIAAPGVGILSTVSGGDVGEKNGTSMAAPVVAGAAGLLLSVYPNLTFSQLKERILNTANAAKLYGGGDDGAINVQYYYPKISGEAVRRPLLGGGYLDVNAMLVNEKNSATGQPIDRVTAGCAVVGSSSSGNALMTLMLLVLPLALGAFRPRSK